MKAEDQVRKISIEAQRRQATHDKEDGRKSKSPDLA